jgi:hypothetical protein
LDHASVTKHSLRYSLRLLVSKTHWRYIRTFRILLMTPTLRPLQNNAHNFDAVKSFVPAVVESVLLLSAHC